MLPTTVILKPESPARWGQAVFLSFWLCGWAAGEAAVLAGVGWVAFKTFEAGFERTFHELGGRGLAVAIPIGLFVLTWLALWTYGGYTAIRDLLRLLSGSDEIDVDSLEIRIRRRTGPWMRPTTIARADVDDLWIRRRDGAAIVRVNEREQVLTFMGSRAARQELVATIRSGWALDAPREERSQQATPPAYWVEETAHDGTRRLLRSADVRAKRVGCVAIPAVPLLVTFLVQLRSTFGQGTLVLGVFALAFGLLLAFVMLEREEWSARRGLLRKRRKLWTIDRVREWRSGRLVLRREVDSNGDDVHTLALVDGSQRVTLRRGGLDYQEVDALGRWLAAHTGFAYEAPEDLGR